MARKKNKKEVTRFLPGTLVMETATHNYGVVEHSYADAYGGDDYESLSIMWLKEGNCRGHVSAWHNASGFVEVPFKEMVSLYLKVGLAKLMSELI